MPMAAAELELELEVPVVPDGGDLISFASPAAAPAGYWPAYVNKPVNMLHCHARGARHTHLRIQYNVLFHNKINKLSNLRCEVHFLY